MTNKLSNKLSNKFFKYILILIQKSSVMSLWPNKGFHCFLEKETSHSLLSTGSFAFEPDLQKEQLLVLQSN